MQAWRRLAQMVVAFEEGRGKGEEAVEAGIELERFGVDDANDPPSTM